MNLRGRALSPRAILAVGVAGLGIYAFPGYLSYDSVLQLGQARAGWYTDGHPPAMALIWRLVELVIAGPVGMLLIQIACFTAGAYVILRRMTTPTRAAVATVALLWFPPIAATLAVIWKDSQMMGFMLLGAALISGASRGQRLAGLWFLLLGTAVRYNGFTITLPIVALLFVWNDAHRPLLRYAIAAAAWLAITVAALAIDRVLTDEQTHIWHQTVGMVDIAGTLRFSRKIPDAELRETLAGTPLRTDHDIAERARKAYNPAWMMNEIWSDDGLFAPATTDAQLDAIARAWRAIVPHHKLAYLKYRWQVFEQLLQLKRRTVSTSVYSWFTDVQDLPGSADKITHDAAPSRIQAQLRKAMQWLGTGWLFRPIVYLVLAAGLTVVCRRQRLALALLASGVLSVAALFIAANTPDFRYSIWLVVSSLLVAAMEITRRIRPEPT